MDVAFTIRYADNQGIRTLPLDFTGQEIRGKKGTDLFSSIYVIRHQAESVHLYAVERFEDFQRVQVVLEIGFLRKHHLLVVPSLHYVMGVIRNHDSPKSRHRSVCAFT